MRNLTAETLSQMREKMCPGLGAAINIRTIAPHASLKTPLPLRFHVHDQGIVRIPQLLQKADPYCGRRDVPSLLRLPQGRRRRGAPAGGISSGCQRFPKTTDAAEVCAESGSRERRFESIIGWRSYELYNFQILQDGG